MGRSFLKQTAEILRIKQRRKHLKRAMVSLSVIVAMLTSYLLILPAVTMERDPICGQEEHTHTDECYEHCLICGKVEQNDQPETTQRILSCPFAAQQHAGNVIHLHDDNCYDADGNLVCTLPEVKQHVHDGSCYKTETVLICGQTEAGVQTIEESSDPFSDGADAYGSGDNNDYAGDSENGHTHTEECYETKDTLVCGKDEIIPHTHTAECYDENGNLVCGRPEMQEHQHDENCFQTVTTEAVEGHTHTEECYEDVLICDKAEHVHTEECYPQENNENDEETDNINSDDPENPVTEEPGSEENMKEESVVEDKQEGDELPEDASEDNQEGDEQTEDNPEDNQETDEQTEDVSEESQETEESADETEIPSYLCGKDEHIHGEGCWDEDENLICGLEEHTHSDECKTKKEPESEETQESDTSADETETSSYVCGMEEHVHSEECLDEEGNLICGQKEHVHDETCVQEEDDFEEMEPPKILAAEGSDYVVQVSYTAEAQIPDGAELVVRKIQQGTEEYEDYYKQAVAAVQGEDSKSLAFARFFDITFLADGIEIEPAVSVVVKITYKEAVEVPEGSEVKSVHLGKETEVLDVQTNEIDGAVAEVTFDASNFSVYAIVGTEILNDKVITADGETYQVSVRYGADAMIPIGSALKVKEINPGSDEYKTELNNAEALLNRIDKDLRVSQARFFDISIMDGNAEVEPAADVKVEITAQNISSVSDGLYLTHTHNNQTEIINAITEIKSENEVKFTFETDSFSNYGTVNTKPNDGITSYAEDENFIIVQKEFRGIGKEIIPDNFCITVTNKSTNESIILNQETAIINDDGLLWKWKIRGAVVGEYAVTEENEKLDDYDLSTTGTGQTVEVSEAQMVINKITHETTCSKKEWPVDDGKFFAGTLTDGGVVVITEYSLSAAQRIAVEKYVLTINGPWKTPVYFYSLEDQVKDGAFTIKGETVTYNKESGEVIFSATRIWQHVATLSYDVEQAAQNPEIYVLNEYTKKQKEITIVKVDQDNNKLGGAYFELLKGNENIEGSPFISDSEHGNTFQLPYGDDYKLTETKAPDGYIIPDGDVYFKVSDSGVILVDSGGKEKNYNNVKVSDNGLVITITNVAGKALPNTGGTGTLPYTLSGLMLIATALMYGFVSRRRRERRLR